MKIFYKNELKALWPFYLELLISKMLYILPAFFVVYFVDIKLSFSQIGVLLAIPAFTSFLFEIPTGAIADLYGRKFSVLLGYFLQGAFLLSLFFVKNYYFILFILFLWGFATTFSSGSKEAWIVDLARRKDKNLVRRFFHKSQVIEGFALIVSGIIGALFVKTFGAAIIWPMAAISFLISIVILLFAGEYRTKGKVKISESFKGISDQTKRTISYGYKHHVLYYFLIAGFLFIFAANFNMGLTWIPFLQELNFPDYAFGYMWSLMAGVSMIAPFFSQKLLTTHKEKKFIIICLSLSAIVTLFVLLSKSWLFALSILIFVSFLIELRTPATRIYFHRFVPSKLRATMGSVENLLITIAATVSTLIVGYLIDLIGPRYSILLYAPLTIPVILLYLKIKEK